MAVGRSQAAVLIAPRPNAKFIIAASSAMGSNYPQGAETGSAVSQPLADAQGWFHRQRLAPRLVR